MPMGSQGFCGDGSGLLGLHWVCCNGRGPSLGPFPSCGKAVCPFVRGPAVSERGVARSPCAGARGLEKFIDARVPLRGEGSCGGTDISLDVCRWPQGASQNAYEKSGILWRWEWPLGPVHAG